MNTAATLVTPPAEEPVLIGDVKKHLRVNSALAGSPVGLAADPTGVVRANGVVTVTPASGQALPGIGQTIVLAGVADASFNGLDGNTPDGYTVQSLVGSPTPTGFTFNQSGPNATSGGGTWQIMQADDESTILGYMKAARRVAEVFMRRAIITQTWKQVFDYFPPMGLLGSLGMGYSMAGDSSGVLSYSRVRTHFNLYWPRLQSVISVQYLNTNDVLTTLATSVYEVDNISEPGRVVPAFGQYWPPQLLEANAVTINFIAGFGDHTTVPEDIKTAIMMLTAQFYENREVDESKGGTYSWFENLLWDWRVLEM